MKFSESSSHTDLLKYKLSNDTLPLPSTFNWLIPVKSTTPSYTDNGILTLTHEFKTIWLVKS